MSTTEKRCSRCGATKPVTEFHKKSESGDGFDYHCKKCKGELKKDYLLRKKEKEMSGKTVTSMVNSLSTIEKKVYECLEETSYSSPSKIQAVIKQRFHTNIDPAKTLAILDMLSKRGLAVRSDGQLFSKVPVKGAKKPAAKDETEYATTNNEQHNEEVEMKTATTVPAKQTINFDGIRAITIKMLDVANEISQLAAAMDAQITAAESKAAANELEFVRLRQIQSLLKDLAGGA